MASEAEGSPDRAGPHVVVVDDDGDVLHMMRFVLEGAGYRVQTFLDAEAAFGALGAQVPDLVITDLMMGDLDSGFSLTKRIKEDPRLTRVPVVIMTAVESQCGYDFTPKSPEDLAAMQADAFFSKPVDPEALLRQVRELLAKAGG